MTTPNRIKCKFCSWSTIRFRGRKLVGEGNLRLHVVEEHQEEYLHQQGLLATSPENAWTRDTLAIGEQAL